MAHTQRFSAGFLKKLHTAFVTFSGVSLNQSENCCINVLSTVCFTIHHCVSAAFTKFNGTAVFIISFFSVALLSRSGVAAFLKDMDGAHNKSLALTVGVVV